MPPYSPEQALAAFDAMDHDSDGYVSVNAVKQVLEQLKVTPSNMNRILGRLDVTRDGKVSEAELKIALGLTEQSGAEYARLFNSLDHDRSGKVSMEEVKKLFAEAGLDTNTTVVRMWIEEMDKDGDGQVDFDELLEEIANRSELG